MSYFDRTTLADSTNTLINPASDEAVVLLRRIAKLLESSAVTDANQRQRVIVEQATAANMNATISGTVSANSTAVASTVNMGQVVVGFGGQATAAANIIDSRFYLIDTARTAYSTGIRANLSWS